MYKSYEDMKSAIIPSHSWTDCTTRLSNFDLEFGWMMDRLHDLNDDYDMQGVYDEEFEELPDTMDAMAHVTVRFEDVEEELAEQMYLQDLVDSGAYDEHDGGSSWDDPFED